MGKVKYSISERPFPGETVSGDSCFVKQLEDGYIFVVLDVTGHGTQAALVANKLMQVLEDFPSTDIKAVMENLHKNLVRYSSAVGSSLYVNEKTGECTIISLGDVTARIIGQNNRFLVTASGLLGYAIPTLIPTVLYLEEGAILVVHTDGIKRHTNDNAEDSHDNNVERVTEYLLEKFSKETDDALCLAIRWER